MNTLCDSRAINDLMVRNHILLHAARDIWGNPNRINLNIVKTKNDIKLIWNYAKRDFKLSNMIINDYRTEPKRVNLIYAHSIEQSIDTLTSLEKTSEELHKKLSAYKTTPCPVKGKSKSDRENIRAIKKLASSITLTIETIRKQIKEFYAMGIILNARIPAKERDLLFDYLNAHNFLEIIPINVRSAFIAPRNNWNHSQTKGRN